MNKKIDMAKFMKECMLTNDDKKQMRSLDNKTMKDDPNYPKNKRVNLEYYNEDELDDIAVDDYSDCDGREDIETLGDLGMDVY
jgi:hypothetical protein